MLTETVYMHWRACYTITVWYTLNYQFSHQDFRTHVDQSCRYSEEFVNIYYDCMDKKRRVSDNCSVALNGIDFLVSTSTLNLEIHQHDKYSSQMPVYVTLMDFTRLITIIVCYIYCSLEGSDDFIKSKNVPLIAINCIESSYFFLHLN